MEKLTFREVRTRCTQDRFFPYEGFHDKLFSRLSIYLVWFFLRLGWSGNAVSVLSGTFAVIGGVLIASSNQHLVIVGSFAYALFYLLDYVDGGVARFNSTSGVGGQYVDLAMHVVSSLGYAAGIFAGAMSVTGNWIIPFGVLTIVAAALNLDRYSLGWFSITMHYQHQLAKERPLELINVTPKKLRLTKLCSFFKLISAVLFHENYAIFVFPLLAIGQFILELPGFDFRVILILFGGVVYFPYVFFDILRLAKNGDIDQAYNKLFIEKKKPELPNDHFFK
jgi:hypothetical protein